MSKFVLVTPDYPPARGGIARYLGNLVETSEGGVRVIVPEKHSSVGPGDISHAAFIGPGWPAWRPLVGMIRQIKDETVLVSHVFPIGTAAWIAKMRGGPEYIVLLHGLDVRLAGRNPWKRWLFRRVCRGARNIVANSKATAKDAERLLGTVPIIVTPGVEEASIPTKEAARRELGLSPEAAVVLSVTRLVPRKGIDVALHAMARLQKEVDVAYVVLGDGDDVERLEKMAAEHRTNVRWVRSADETVKWNWFAAADVFLLPVRDEGNDVEGFGIVFLEAALAGVASVAGKSGGAVEAVIHEQTGLLVNPTDVDAVLAATLRLLGDEDLRAKLGQRGKERALNDFRWEDRWAKIASL